LSRTKARPELRVRHRRLAASSPRTEPHDSREQRLAAERMLPRLANDPRDRIDPADPTDPIDSTDPTDPIDSTDPTESIDSTDPRDRMERTDRLRVDVSAPFPIHPRYGGSGRPAGLEQHLDDQLRVVGHGGMPAARQRHEPGSGQGPAGPAGLVGEEQQVAPAPGDRGRDAGGGRGGVRAVPELGQGGVDGGAVLPAEAPQVPDEVRLGVAGGPAEEQ